MAAGWLLPGVTLAMGLPAGLVAMADDGRDGMAVWLFCLELRIAFYHSEIEKISSCETRYAQYLSNMIF